MSLIKVLGIGSPFGDDQAGCKVAELLKQKILPHVYLFQHISIESHDRPGLRLIELMNGASTVFIIDAVKSGSETGTIHRFKKQDILASECRLSTHDMGVIQALQLGEALKALPENIIFYGIETDKIAIEATMSLNVERAVETVANQLKDELVSVNGILP